MLGLLFGITGILLNHRAVIKIPAAASIESAVQVELPDAARQDPKAFALWFGVYAHRPQPIKPKVMPSKTVIWNDQPVQKPEEWTATVAKPGFALTASWNVDNRYAEVTRVEQNLWGMLNQIHKGQVLGAGWILLADTLAGGLIVPGTDRLLVVVQGAWPAFAGAGFDLRRAGVGQLGCLYLSGMDV